MPNPQNIDRTAFVFIIPSINLTYKLIFFSRYPTSYIPHKMPTCTLFSTSFCAVVLYGSNGQKNLNKNMQLINTVSYLRTIS